MRVNVGERVGSKVRNMFRALKAYLNIREKAIERSSLNFWLAIMSHRSTKMLPVLLQLTPL